MILRDICATQLKPHVMGLWDAGTTPAAARMGMAWANGHGHRSARTATQIRIIPWRGHTHRRHRTRAGQRPAPRRAPGRGPRRGRTGSASIVRPPLLALLIFAFLDFVVSRYIKTGYREIYWIEAAGGAGAPPTPARATPGPGVAGPSSDLRPSSPVPSRAAPGPASHALQPGRARRPPRLDRTCTAGRGADVCRISPRRSAVAGRASHTPGRTYRTSVQRTA